VYGYGRIGPLENDLRRQHAREPLGERIIIEGRVLDEDGRPVPGTLVEIWQYAGSRRGSFPAENRQCDKVIPGTEMMSDVTVDGCRLSFSVEGPEDAPALLLVNALGATRDLWTFELDRFARSFRVIRYDARGHGRSDVPSGPYSLDRLGQDALAILDAAGVAQAHICGLSLGGMVAMWLGVNSPERVARLIAANTGARIGTTELWEERIRNARSLGMPALAASVIPRWFTQEFRERQPETVDRFRSMLAACPVEGYAGCCAAVRDADLREDIQRIGAATLVIRGIHDVATPPGAADFIRERVAGARLVALDAAHLSNVEQPEAFTSAVVDFL